MALTLHLNGQPRTFAELDSSTTLAEVVSALGLKADRVALELNGEIVARSGWAAQLAHSGDKLEVVHFVGGGSPSCVTVAAELNGASTVCLTSACEADYRDIVGLANLAYRGEAGWTTEAGLIAGDRLSETQLRQDLAAAPGAQLLVIREENGVLPIASVWLEPKGSGVWYLGLLTVHPGLQGSGLGRQVLGAAEIFARKRGATRMRLTVLSAREQLVAWYMRRGYAPTGETLPFPAGDHRCGVPLQNGLYFQVLEREL